MPTKDKLRRQIVAILKDKNLEGTSVKKVHLQLEVNLKFDLPDRSNKVPTPSTSEISSRKKKRYSLKRNNQRKAGKQEKHYEG